MSLDERFNKAAEDVKKLKTSPKDDDLLEVYALFKQGSVGDVNVPKPTGLLDFKGKAKWEAWNGKKGMSCDEAKEAYIAKVQQLIDTIGF
ncbi:putative acyl-CoA-binding protein [Ischnura elegans]|uniref:putative acyl-CoA-binding protein n=1 Tax=Ischnura elegans TaxID=197161 RepID=UPI001ED88BA0|nr:putative acyl-CoA-binding protein [Ischnura elegans]XP_046390684.1 putative acyl-CoA-binding protein [Ischnura elegans]XP_046390685.1 putative acyl-CoA-binding protein [Ischnura elegans]